MSAILYRDKVYGAGGSGGGGSTVTITPTLSSGTKIADFEIDGDSGELYAPQGGGGSGSILSGTTAPSNAIGSDGDIYYQYKEGAGSDWTADSEYLVSDANTVFDVLSNSGGTTRNFKKTNSGKAIAINYASDSWSGGMLVSQDALSCYYTNEGGAASAVNSAVIDGVTWYISKPNAWITGKLFNSNGVAPDMEFDYSTQPPTNAAIIIPLILAAANEHSVAVAESIVATYFKQDGIWLKDETGTKVEANPTDTATDNLTKIEIDGVVYNVSDVEANPTGTATQTLSKLRVGNTIYNVPSGGGGGGSYTETTLFTGSHQTYQGEITLSDDMDNYDQIVIYARWATTSTNGSTPFVIDRAYFVSHYPYDNGSTAQTTNHLVLCPYSNQYIRVKCGSANNKLFLFNANSIAIERVAGIKY